MNKLNLIWIIPLCIVLGFSIGLYYSIPQNYTIDYGENMLYVVKELENINLNMSHCPACNCNDKFIKSFYKMYDEQYWQNCDNKRILYKIEAGIHRLENNTKTQRG